MSYVDIFNQRNEDYGSSMRNVRINSTKSKISSTFKNSPNYYQVSTFTPSSPLTSTPLDVWITDDSKLKDQKQVIATPDQSLDNGYLFSWKNTYWLIVNADPNLGDVYSRGIAWKCYSSLKWLDEKGIIREVPFAYRLDFYRGSGTNDGKALIMPSERRYLYVQDNEYTHKIKKDHRFIFDSRVWKVTAYDRTFFGLIYLELEENLESNANDNMELRIADYWNNIHTYSIKILNGISSTINVLDTLQLNVETIDNVNGKVVSSSLPVTYTVSDESIATISDTGLISALTDGEVTIASFLTDHPSISTSILLSISSVVIDDYSVVVTGADVCKVSYSQTYLASIYNNSTPDTSKTVYWSLMNDTMNSSTDLAQITSQNESGCTIKGLKFISPPSASFIRVIATCVEDGSLVGNKRVQMKSVMG